MVHQISREPRILPRPTHHRAHPSHPPLATHLLREPEATHLLREPEAELKPGPAYSTIQRLT